MERGEDERQADDWVERYVNTSIEKVVSAGLHPPASNGPSAPSLQDLERLKARRIVPSRGRRLVTITGPNVHGGGEHEELQTWGGVVAGRTISTYPMRGDDSGMRDGDPICDRYGAAIYENRHVVVVADGCNWGVAPMTAAHRARDAVLEYLNEKDRRIRDVGEAALYLLRSFSYAHRKMSQRAREQENLGTSTLIASMVVELEREDGAARRPAEEREWAFVCASVGDCKAFHIDGQSHAVTDITNSNRATQEHANDCGGRLGPTQADGGPDLRNLNTFFFPCRRGDWVACMSDGVHDNFHPRMLGVSPRSLALGVDDWNDVADAAAAEAIVVNFRTQFFADQVVAGGEVSCRGLVERSLAHAHATTQSSRTFMETNPGRRLPKDYKLYPGKMDHTTMVVSRIGLVEGAMIQRPATVPAGEPPHVGTARQQTGTGAGAVAVASDPGVVRDKRLVQPRQPTEWARTSPELALSSPTKANEAKIGSHARAARGKAEAMGSSASGTNVPLAVTVTQRPGQLAIYCRATAKSKFECIAKPHEIVLVVTPSKLFELADEESVVGGVDELNAPYKRSVALPPEINIDIKSKRMSYDPDMGIITILFRLL